MLRKFVFAVAGWVVLLIPSIFFLVPLFLLYIARLLVTRWLRRLFRKDLVGSIDMPDALFTLDSFWDRPLGCISFVHIVHGRLDPDAIEKRLSEVLFGRRGLGSERVANYDRLTSVYPSYWLGYPFWTRAESEFDIQKHVRVQAMGPMDQFEKELHSVLKVWLVSPLHKGRPLWDVLVIPGNSMKFINLF